MRQNYHHTFIDSDRCLALAICPDNKLRKITLTNGGIADTFFSIPARVKAKGKTITGYVTVQTMDGYDTETINDPAVVKFVPYSYGKNGDVFNSDNEKGKENA